MGNHRMFVQHGQIYHRTEISGLLWNRKQPAEETQGAAPVDWLYGPLLQQVVHGLCRSCFLLLVRKWMGVLVKGGWWHSHFNRTPDHRILDDLHSPSRFCHCWAKTARRAPTNTPSLSGLLWCIRWRSCCFVTCSAVRSKRTGYIRPGQLVVLAFDAHMVWTV